MTDHRRDIGQFVREQGGPVDPVALTEEQRKPLLGVYRSVVSGAADLDDEAESGQR